MTLGELIDRLESVDPDTHVPMGFSFPHSYRGYYNELAFEPAANTTIGQMLFLARGCIDYVFTGHKGGEFKMTLNTPVWLAYSGSSANSEMIGTVLLKYMMGEY